MEHFTFRIGCLLVLITSIIGASLYTDFSLKHRDINLIVGMKSIPVASMILLNIWYFVCYRVTIYSGLMLAFLTTCLIGDVMLGFDNDTLFIVGGASFFIGRIVLTILFALKPKQCKCIRHCFCRSLMSNTINTAVYFVIGLCFLIYNGTLKSTLYFLYITIGLSLPSSYSFLRIYGLEHESKISCWIGFIGTLLYNISDILLLAASDFKHVFPEYTHLISNWIYWVGIYLITLSLIRSNSEETEKLGYYQLPIFVVVNSEDYLE